MIKLGYEIWELPDGVEVAELIATFQYSYDAENYIKYLRSRREKCTYWCQHRLFD